MTGRKTAKRPSKQTKPGEKEEDYQEDSKLEEEIASMLESEYGKDTEVLQLIEELEKAPEEDTQSEAHSKETDQSDIRKCRNCGIEALFINDVCTECGHSLTDHQEEPEEEDSPDDEPVISGYNIDSDE
jgi:hypothetical protein